MGSLRAFLRDTVDISVSEQRSFCYFVFFFSFIFPSCFLIAFPFRFNLHLTALSRFKKNISRVVRPLGVRSSD